MEVIVLNTDYSYLHKLKPKRAMKLIEKGRVTVEKYSDRVMRTVDGPRQVPAIIRIIKMVREVYRRKVTWKLKNVLIRDDYTCVYCGAKKDEIKHTKEGDPYRVIINVDHVHPTSRGGRKDSFENTVAACFQCNNVMKGDKTLQEAHMYYKNRMFKPVSPTIAEFTHKMYSNLGIKQMLEELMYGEEEPETA